MKEIHVGDSKIIVSDEIADSVDFEEQAKLIIPGDSHSVMHAVIDLYGEPGAQVSGKLHSFRVDENDGITLGMEMDHKAVTTLLAHRKMASATVMHGDMKMFKLQQRNRREPSISVEVDFSMTTPLAKISVR